MEMVSVVLYEDFLQKLAPKAIPVIKQLGMKAIGLIGEKIAKPISDLAGSAASTIKDRITRLISKPKLTPVILPATEQMSPKITKEINQVVNKKITELTEEPDSKQLANLDKQQQQNIVSSLVVGSGLCFRR